MFTVFVSYNIDTLAIKLEEQATIENLLLETGNRFGQLSANHSSKNEMIVSQIYPNETKKLEELDGVIRSGYLRNPNIPLFNIEKIEFMNGTISYKYVYGFGQNQIKYIVLYDPSGSYAISL